MSITILFMSLVMANVVHDQVYRAHTVVLASIQ